MQAFSRWSPPGGTLGRIVGEARERASALAARAPALRARALDAPPVPRFAAALRRDAGAFVAVIAEVKRSSPSKGRINPGIDTAAQAMAYARGGAAALSILTETRHFGGAAADLETARGAVAIPLLRKDFIVGAAQLFEARALGASAALLIVRALSPDELDELAGVAAAIGLETLVEVRDETELERALRTATAAIGVNNRDLETLAIDLETGDRMVPMIPPDRVAVWESGIAAAADVERAAAAGADAVLVGSSVSAAGDPEAAVRALTRVTRGEVRTAAGAGNRGLTSAARNAARG